MKHKSNNKVVMLNEVAAKQKNSFDLNSDSGRVEIIQMLIPLGLEAMAAILQEEVRSLTGQMYERGYRHQRWGSNPGSGYLGDQKVKLDKVPRVRNKETGEFVSLKSYQQFQNSGVIDKLNVARVLGGLCQGRYKEASLNVAETFGISKSSVSRRFVKATGKTLKKLMNRDLSKEAIVAIFLDGKYLSEYGMVIALGVRLDGSKVVLGFVETASENSKVCGYFLEGLLNRGLQIEEGILVIIDGSTGMKKAIEEVFKEKAIIQRCQWHKRENVLSYLSKEHQELFRNKLQNAYNKESYEGAKKALEKVRKELSLVNESAVRSLDEGFEETLTLHKLGMFSKLGISLKTTNVLESINSQIESATKRVKYWKNSSQRQRWVAVCLLDIEPKLRRIKNYKYLPELKKIMKEEVQQQKLKVA